MFGNIRTKIFECMNNIWHSKLPQIEYKYENLEENIVNIWIFVCALVPMHLSMASFSIPKYFFSIQMFLQGNFWKSSPVFEDLMIICCPYNITYFRVSLTLACPMNLKLFPLDTQTCHLTIASYGWTSRDLQYIWKVN